MKARMLAFITILATACAAAGQAPLPSPVRQLVNASFDAGGSGIQGWATRGDQYATAELVTDKVASKPRALKLVVRGPGSSGDKSFMIYQVLDPAAYRGKRVTFGAKVWTDGGASNITLYTPGKFANDFFTDLHSGRYVERSASIDVPADATFLSFGIQVFGTAGATISVDDAFVTTGDAPHAVGPTRTQSTSAGSTTRATVSIDASRVTGTLKPMVFGMHIEWTAHGNGLVDANGALRSDVLAALKPLQIPLFRFPGGILADYYDWNAAVPPHSRRSKALNVFTGKTEAEDFGMDELRSLLQTTGASALMTANYGTGTADQAGAWARYLAQAGIPAPLWEVGNEIYLADRDRDQPNGRRIYHRPEEYAADYGRYRAAIRTALPSARVGAIAHIDSGAYPLAPAQNASWTSRMFKALTTGVDFLSVHDAYSPVIINDSVDFGAEAGRRRAYQAMYGSVRQTQANLQEVQDLYAASRPGQPKPPIAVTEFGPLFGVSRKKDVQTTYVDQSRTMAAALYVASLLDAFISDPDVLLACYTNPIHRWYGSLLTDTDQGLIKTPTYYLYRLYRSRFDSALVPATVSAPTFDSETTGLARAESGVPDLIVRASIAPDHSRLTAMLVNRSLDHTLDTTIAVTGFDVARADCQILAAASPNAINGPSLTATTRTGGAIAPHTVACSGTSAITLTIPPNAIVSLEAEGRR